MSRYKIEISVPERCLSRFPESPRYICTKPRGHACVEHHYEDVLTNKIVARWIEYSWTKEREGASSR